HGGRRARHASLEDRRLRSGDLRRSLLGARRWSEEAAARGRLRDSERYPSRLAQSLRSRVCDGLRRRRCTLAVRESEEVRRAEERRGGERLVVPRLSNSLMSESPGFTDESG